MREHNHLFRFLTVLIMLILGVAWSLASAQSTGKEAQYPNGQFLATVEWLRENLTDENLLVVDVRTDAHFDGRLIPGSIRLPWTRFRHNDTMKNEGGLFVGAAAAQQILGDHGIGRTNTVILYDSVAEDGGATASYVFLILDLLGHEQKRIVDGGIDAWEQKNYQLASRPRQLSPILYQAPMDEIRQRAIISGYDIYHRLGDPHYQLIDVRSAAEYKGEKGTKDLLGRPLKLGHIPTAVNIGYEGNWIDHDTKLILPYETLRQRYGGLDPDNSIVVYCNSGRRSSYGYYILRLLGFDRVRSYEASWKEWGKPSSFFPVETAQHVMPAPPAGSTSAAEAPGQASTNSGERDQQGRPGGSSVPESGYVSCGG